MKFPVTFAGRAGKATRTLVAGAALAVAAGGLGVSAAYAAPVEGPAPAPAESSANGINSVTGSTPGASTATGGLSIQSVKVTRPYDTVSVGNNFSVRIDYTGKNVSPGATFTADLGPGLQVPTGLSGIKLKATALDGSTKEIGTAKIADGKFTFTIDESVNTLGGNGALNNAFVEYNVEVSKDAVGKKSTTITVDGTTYDISLGKGVVGEAFHPGADKYLYAAGKDDAGHYVMKGYVQATVAPGTALKAVEKGANATFGSAFYCTNDGNWANTTKATANKLNADKTEITAVAPATGEGDWTCRVSITQTGDSKKFVNTAVINEQEVSATATWRAKGDSGADTEADPEPEKPVTPAPEPTPTPEPTPDKPVTPTPDEPKPTPTPEPTPDKPVTPEPNKPEEPKPTPTPEPTPDKPVTPEPNKPEEPKPTPTPEPTPDKPVTPEPNKPEEPKPTPTPEPTPEKPVTPAPEPEKPVTPEPNKPEEPKPTPEKPTEPSPEKPVTPTPDKPVTPETPKGEEPKPAPSATPTTEQPKPSTPAPAPSAPAAAGQLPKTGADMGVLGAAATALAGGVAALVAARRRRR